MENHDVRFLADDLPLMMMVSDLWALVPVDLLFDQVSLKWCDKRTHLLNQRLAVHAWRQNVSEMPPLALSRETQQTFYFLFTQTDATNLPRGGAYVCRLDANPIFLFRWKARSHSYAFHSCFDVKNDRRFLKSANVSWETRR